MNTVPFSHVGLEIEYTDFNPKVNKKFINFLNKKGWIITHDASVESPTIVLGNRPVSGKLLSRDINRNLLFKEVIGGELVSGIIDTSFPNWIKDLDSIFLFMKACGERKETNRGSIHIHINYPRVSSSKGEIQYSLDQLLNPWILAGYLEAAFFRLGSMGYKHRGENMDFIYYRPITKSGPQIVSDANGKFKPILDYYEVLNSKDIKEFFIRCGDIGHAESRYHPSRYLWINFFNMFNKSQGHLEFRVFNKTLNWLHLYSMVELCKHFVAKCFKHTTRELKEIVGGIYSLDDPPSNDEQYFNNIIRLLEIKSDIVVSTLYDIWQRSTWPDYIDSKVYSHLFNKVRVHNGGKFSPKILSKEEMSKVTKPFFVDIHFLRNRRMTIFPENK